MDIFEKLKILTDAAKYDAACTSSGVDRKASINGIGNSSAAGICHSFAGDGRCISLLKVLMSNACAYDCKYCVNRTSNDTRRASFTPQELANLTINFYRRNYIEGLFLSSGIMKNPNYTTEQMIEVLRILREDYNFSGYIHAKAIPGTDEILINRLGRLCDRMSVNIELPSQKSLKLLAPDKSKHSILTPMKQIKTKISEASKDIIKYRHAPKFVPAGQSTQMIIGATPDTDFQILSLSESLYKKFKLKRVFYSAYMPVTENSLLPSTLTKPPLLREHRLYQADWLIRFYGFRANELLDKQNESFNPYIDPKCNWALNNLGSFPIEINSASYNLLLRVPGIGVNSARRIVVSRKSVSLDFNALKKLGVVLKRAKYFITCSGKLMDGVILSEPIITRALMSPKTLKTYEEHSNLNLKKAQISFFDDTKLLKEDLHKCLTGQI